jgi:hypothetical protein
VYNVGDTGPGGGIVFYDAGSTQLWGRYLEAACAGWQNNCDGSADPQTGWGCYETSIYVAFGTQIGIGEQNTSDVTAIVGGCPDPGTAARLANDLVLNGQGDWFLPSKDELNLMYTYKSTIGGFSTNRWDLYWSSSASVADYYAWWQDFGNGDQNASEKDGMCYVRPVRAF